VASAGRRFILSGLMLRAACDSVKRVQVVPRAGLIRRIEK